MNKTTDDITIYLYYMGDYAMKYEHLSRKEADDLLEEWNDISRVGWLAKE
jgi:hypothetical protein